MEYETCPTVRIVAYDAPGGFVVINESDLTDDMTLYSEDVVDGGETVGQATPRRRGRPPRVAEGVSDGAN